MNAYFYIHVPEWKHLNGQRIISKKLANKEEHERCINKMFDTEEKAKRYCEEDSDTLIGKTYYEAEVE